MAGVAVANMMLSSCPEVAARMRGQIVAANRAQSKSHFSNPADTTHNPLSYNNHNVYYVNLTNNRIEQGVRLDRLFLTDHEWNFARPTQ